MQIYRARQIHMKWTLHYTTITSGFSTGSCWNLLPNKHFCRFYTCIQNQIIDKHVYVYHNPSTGIIVLIVSLQLSIVPYAAGPESWCHSMRLYIDVKLLPKSHCSLNSYFHGSAYPRKLVLTLQYQQQIWLEKFEENSPNLFASYKYSGKT